MVVVAAAGSERGAALGADGGKRRLAPQCRDGIADDSPETVKPAIEVST